jgi:hypothetical protein
MTEQVVLVPERPAASEKPAEPRDGRDEELVRGDEEFVGAELFLG